MDIEEQKSVKGCFDSIQKLWSETDTMAGRLRSLLGESLPDKYTQEDDDFEHNYSDDDCIIQDNIYYYLIQKRRPGRKSKKADAYLGFQISFMGDGCDIPGNESPLLHMFYVESFKPGFGGDKLHFGFPGDYEKFTVEADRLAVNRNEVRVVDCFYSLRFLSMSNEKQLKKYCVDPLINIVFNSHKVTEALPDDYLKEGVLVNLPDIKELIEQAD